MRKKEEKEDWAQFSLKDEHLCKWMWMQQFTTYCLAPFLSISITSSASQCYIMLKTLYQSNSMHDCKR